MRIIGVDPGSRLTGYGCVDLVGRQIRLVTHGTLKLFSTQKGVDTPFEQRLLRIYSGLTEVIQAYRPQVMAVEKVFFAKNALSALKLGQARGAVLLCGAIHSLPIVEYNPTEIKASIVGYGRAEKTQVAKMIELLLGRQDFMTADASDALALAIHHAYCCLDRAARPAASRAAASILPPKKRGRARISLAESVAHVAKISLKGD